MKIKDYAYALRAQAGTCLFGELRELADRSEMVCPLLYNGSDLTCFSEGEFRIYPFVERKNGTVKTGVKAVIRLGYGETPLFSLFTEAVPEAIMYLLMEYGRIAAVFTAVEADFRKEMTDFSGDGGDPF